MNIRNFFSSKRLRHGALSGGLVAIVLVLLVLINVVVSVLDDKFSLTLDLTPSSAFKLSDISADYVKTLEKPVSITVLINESDLGNTGDIYLTQAKSVIDQYAQHSDSITVRYVDVISDPTFVAQYQDLNLAYGDVLIDSGTRQRKFALNEMFNADYNQYTGQQRITSSKAEQMITAAIMGVTSESVTKVGILTGHGEMQLPGFESLLAENNFEVLEQSLTLGELDPAVEVLFMFAPTRDPDPEVIKKLDVFLENGGQYGKTLIYTANIEQPALPNLSAFLADWGIGVGVGAVLETDAAKVFNYNQFFCTVDFVEQADYLKNLPQGVKVSMPFGRPLETLFSAQGGYEVKTLLTYSDTAAVMPMDATETWKPESTAAVPAALKSAYTKYEGTTPLISSVVAFSSLSAFEDGILSSRSVANAEYMMALLGDITERENSITIAPKTLGGTELGINQLQASLLSLLLIYLLPFVVVVIGIVIWLRRRHK